jgi:hypothetical protein
LVSIAGGGIQFRLPQDFSLMKGAAVQERWKSPPYPDAAWSSANDLLVAIRFGDLELLNEEVPDALEDMVEAYQAAVPGLVWRSKEAMMLGPTQVLRHEFESSAAAGRMLNVVFSASFGGKLFAITVVGPVGQEQLVVGVARDVQNSLTVR